MKGQTTINNKNKKKQANKASHHQNCVNPFAKGFLPFPMCSNDTDSYLNYDFLLFSILNHLLFSTFYLMSQIFFLHRLMSRVQSVLW